MRWCLRCLDNRLYDVRSEIWPRIRALNLALISGPLFGQEATCFRSPMLLKAAPTGGGVPCRHHHPRPHNTTPANATHHRARPHTAPRTNPLTNTPNLAQDGGVGVVE